MIIASGAAGAEPKHRGDVADVVVIRTLEQHGWGARIWEPYLAQWKGNKLVAAYGVQIAGKTDMGSIFACASTDGGKTWSEPATVFDHREKHGAVQFAYANAILYKAPEQDVMWCFAQRCPMNYQHSEDSQLCAAYSADEGRSWSPVALAMHYTGPLIVVAGIERVMEDGKPRYLLPAHRNTRANDPLGTREQFILSSTTLLEWRLSSYIPRRKEDNVFLHEGNLAPGDAEGELKLVCRTAQDLPKGHGTALDPPRAFSSVSRDGGRTWSVAAAEPKLWNTCAKAPFVRDARGNHLYVYNDGPAWSRMALRYKVKPPGGEWSDERTFFENGKKNSYATLLETAPGEFAAVWDSGAEQRDRTLIRFGRLKLAP
jgi:hypothetical protein